MCGFHQGQRSKRTSTKGRIYGSNTSFVTTEFFPCNTGRTIYDPYALDTGTLGMVDSEVEETEFWPLQNPRRNGFEFTSTGDLILPFNINKLGIDEPTGITFNSFTGTVFVTDDEALRVFELDPNTYQILTSFPTPASQQTGGNDPEGITSDPSNGHLFIANGILPATPGDVVEVTSAGEFVSSFKVPSGVRDPEGIYFDPRSGNLYLTTGGFAEPNDPANDKIWVVSVTGQLVREISLALVNAQFGNPALGDSQAGGRIRPKGVAMAPSSDPADDPSIVSLYVTDWGVDAGNNLAPMTDGNDGRIFELTANQSPTVDAGPNQTLVSPGSTELNGAVSDDGLPEGNTLVILWSQISGPAGGASFDAPSSPDTIVRFSDPGNYVLRLTASDGDIRVFDELTVKVNAGGGGEPRIITAFVDQDSWLKQAARNDNFGSEKELPIKKKRRDNERAVFRFDLSGIVPNSKVEKATAILRVTTPDSRRVKIYSIVEPWSEHTVTWGNTGNAFDPDTVYGSFRPRFDDAFVSVDITGLVQEWACGRPNHGLMFIPTSKDEQSKYYSKEIDISHFRPSMEVEMVVGGASPC